MKIRNKSAGQAQRSDFNPPKNIVMTPVQAQRNARPWQVSLAILSVPTAKPIAANAKKTSPIGWGQRLPGSMSLRFRHNSQPEKIGTRKPCE